MSGDAREGATPGGFPRFSKVSAVVYIETVEYDRLRAIEETARPLLDAIDVGDAANVHGWSEALRAALSAHPDTGVKP